MDTLSLRFVFDRKGETKKDHTKKALVQVEVYDSNSRRKVYISTDVKILRSQYSPNAGFSIKNHPNAAILKEKAYRIYNKVEAFINSDRCNSIDDAKNWDKEEVSASISIEDFIKADLRRRDVSYSVLQYNHSFIRRLNEYGKIRTFNDLSYDSIEGFDQYLRQRISSEPTLYKRHSLFGKHDYLCTGLESYRTVLVGPNLMKLKYRGKAHLWVNAACPIACRFDEVIGYIAQENRQAFDFLRVRIATHKRTLSFTSSVMRYNVSVLIRSYGQCY